jgi:hypothetical protein
MLPSASFTSQIASCGGSAYRLSWYTRGFNANRNVSVTASSVSRPFGADDTPVQPAIIPAVNKTGAHNVWIFGLYL